MGGEVLRKKKSERGRMWEVGEREERRWGGAGGKGCGCCVLAVARVVKRATTTSIAAACFQCTRYC